MVKNNFWVPNSSAESQTWSDSENKNHFSVYANNQVGLRKASDTMVIRMTGCPNGCARPYMAELGFVGDGPNSYQVGGGGEIEGVGVKGLGVTNDVWKGVGGSYLLIVLVVRERERRRVCRNSYRCVAY